MNQDDLKFDEECALKAILALRDASSPLLRRQRKTLALAWYSCHYGITNKNDHTPRFQGRTDKIKAKFDLNYILKTHFVSNAVLDIIERKRPYEAIRLEHALPNKVVDFELEKAEINTTHELRQFLIANVIIAFVTKEEDDRLNKMKLRDQMPADWDGKNIYARYDEAKISGEILRKPKSAQKLNPARSD